MITELGSFEHNDLVTAAFVLHPATKTLYLLFDCDEDRLKHRDTSYAFIRRLIENYKEEVIVNGADAQMGSSDGTSLGSSSFNLKRFIPPSEMRGSTDDDELARVLAVPAPQNLEKISDSKTGVIDFWLDHEKVYPLLFKVAMRVFATPASSAARKSDFSVVNHIMSKKRNRISPGLYRIWFSFVPSSTKSSSGMRRMNIHLLRKRRNKD